MDLLFAKYRSSSFDLCVSMFLCKRKKNSHTKSTALHRVSQSVPRVLIMPVSNIRVVLLRDFTHVECRPFLTPHIFYSYLREFARAWANSTPYRYLLSDEFLRCANNILTCVTRKEHFVLSYARKRGRKTICFFHAWINYNYIQY